MRMIQPINAFTPRAGFRGSSETYGTKKKAMSDSRAAVVNAAGIAAVAGGLTTLVARTYTNSFAHAGVLGVFGAFLTMFFMTPHLVEKIGLGKVTNKVPVGAYIKPETSAKIAAVAKEYAVPVKKLVQFRSEQLPTS